MQKNYINNGISPDKYYQKVLIFNQEEHINLMEFDNKEKVLTCQKLSNFFMYFMEKTILIVKNI